MNRSRLVLTLILVTVSAMLIGLGASTFANRGTAARRPESRPKATEPRGPAVPAHLVVNV